MPESNGKDGKKAYCKTYFCVMHFVFLCNALRITKGQNVMLFVWKLAKSCPHENRWIFQRPHGLWGQFSLMLFQFWGINMTFSTEIETEKAKIRELFHTDYWGQR